MSDAFRLLHDMASEDDYSDLTELESEDECDDSTTKRGKKASGSSVRAGWRIKNALKVPRATTYTAQALYDQIYGCDINLEPEYQRDVVWSEAKQIGIIDSVFRNFYIPPVIFAVNVHEDGSETRTCIDGKQRLTSIHKFMEGLIPHKDPITGEKLYYKDIEATAGRKRKLLPEKYRRLFANKQIVCVEYQDITDSDEREIFQRVQLGMALTPAEKLQVIKTPRTDLVRNLQNQYLKDDGWLGPKHLRWDQTRGNDFRGIAFSAYCMETYSSLKWTLVSMSRLEKWLAIGEPVDPETQTAVEDTFRIFAEIVQDDKLKKAVQQAPKISPIEFIGIALMIFCNRDKVTLAQLAAGIAEMRAAVRSEHIDVRLNTRVSKTVLDFISAWEPKIAGDKGGVANTNEGKAGMKRKRAKDVPEESDGLPDGSEMDVDDKEDATYRPKAKKPSTAKSKSKPSISASAPTTVEIAPVPQVKTEPVASPTPLPAPKPAPVNRMAALQNAKAAVAQKQAARAMQAPTAPRALRESIPNPQMLPSPTQSYAFTDGLASAYSAANGNGHIPIRPPPPNSPPADLNLIAFPMRSASGSLSRPGNLPLPPQSAGSNTDAVHRNAEYDRGKDRDRDRERDRDRDRDRERHPERSREKDRDRYPRYDERDRTRERRESGGYPNQRSRSPSVKYPR